MNNNLVKILILLLLILGVCPNYVQAVETGSISITVTFKEITSEVIVISPGNQSGDPGETLTCKFIVKNNGSFADSYSIKAKSSNKWKVGLSQADTIGPLNPGQQEEVNVWLRVSPKALADKEDVLRLTVTSLSDPDIFSSGSVMTTVNQIAKINIRTYPKFKKGRPSQTIRLRAVIRNSGNGEDSFILTASSSLGWKVEFPQGNAIGPIRPRKRKIVPIRVIVPVDAIKGERDTVAITATSQFDPLVSHSSSFTIIIR